MAGLAWGACLVGAGLGSTAAARAETALEVNSASDLNGLSIEELARIDVSSVSKSAQPLSDAPAAIFVITHDDIQLTGATTVPDLLRLAPNLQVAQITANSDAISARGFNGSAANKLLVLVDGRTVYTPFFSGVFWDSLTAPVDDIDRVEVISGPGATLWGANAVNGVINITSKKSSDTQGGLLEVGGGNLERQVNLRYGGRLSDDLTWRAYVGASDWSHSNTAAGLDAHDGWNRYQGGFRADWARPKDLITVQGDVYRGAEEQLVGAHQIISGDNVLGRWTHTADDGSTLQVQAYYDYLRRSVAGRFADYLSTYDLDMQHSFTLAGAHQIVWGGGYRITRDDFPITPQPPLIQFFDPQRRTLGFGNVFAQDTVSLAPLKLTVGLKLENSAYSGLEALPSVRMSWKVTDQTLLWAAISRAVRAPSRLDRDFVQISPRVTITGGNFQPEKVIAYEAGYRGQPSPRSSLSVSVFYNVYRDLRSFEFSPGGVLPLTIENGMEGETWGVEAWGAYQVTRRWRLSAGFNWLHEDLKFKPGSSRIGGVQTAGDDPRYQGSLRSTLSLTDRLTLDLDLRGVGAPPAPASPAYAELGARIGWAISDRVELSIRGDNLLHDHHAEFGSATANVQLGAVGVESARSVLVDTRWRF